MEHSFDIDRAAQHEPGLDAQHRDDGDKRGAEGVAIDHHVFRDALGAGGADEVLPEHFEHGGPSQSRHNPGGDDGERSRRQDQVTQQVRQVAPAIDGIHARGRQQPPFNRKKQDEDQPQEEGWHGYADQHEEGDNAIGPAELTHRRDDACQYAEHRTDHQ
ncbi:hypothetical protein D3C87_1456390 [compost metagenome]